MDFADKLDMMDDDCDIDGFPNDTKGFKTLELYEEHTENDEHPSMITIRQYGDKIEFLVERCDDRRTGAYVQAWIQLDHKQIEALKTFLS